MLVDLSIFTYAEEMEIRLIKESEIEELAHVFVEAFNSADPEKPWSYENALANLKYWFKKQPDLFYVAIEKDKIIGTTMVNIKPWRTGIRCTDGVLFVDPKSHRSGIGKKLLIRVLEEAIAKYGATSVEAVTFAAKEFPLTWYEKIGISPDKGAVLIKGNCADILNNLKS